MISFLRPIPPTIFYINSNAGLDGQRIKNDSWTRLRFHSSFYFIFTFSPTSQLTPPPLTPTPILFAQTFKKNCFSDFWQRGSNFTLILLMRVGFEKNCNFCVPSIKKFAPFPRLSYFSSWHVKQKMKRGCWN